MQHAQRLAHGANTGAHLAQKCEAIMRRRCRAVDLPVPFVEDLATILCGVGAVDATSPCKACMYSSSCQIQCSIQHVQDTTGAYSAESLHCVLDSLVQGIGPPLRWTHLWTGRDLAVNLLDS